MRQFLAVAFALVLASGPAHGQDGEAPTAPAQHDSADLEAHKAALNAQGDAFRERLQAIGAEMAAAARQAGPGAAGAAVDVVEARHRPEIDAMQAAITDFLAAHPDHQSRWSENSAPAIETALDVLKMRASLAATGF